MRIILVCNGADIKGNRSTLDIILVIANQQGANTSVGPQPSNQ